MQETALNVDSFLEVFSSPNFIDIPKKNSRHFIKVINILYMTKISENNSGFEKDKSGTWTQKNNPTPPIYNCFYINKSDNEVQSCILTQEQFELLKSQPYIVFLHSKSSRDLYINTNRIDSFSVTPQNNTTKYNFHLEHLESSRDFECSLDTGTEIVTLYNKLHNC